MMVELIASSLFISLFLIVLQLVIGLFIGKVNELFFENHYKIFTNSNAREHNLITIIGTPIHELGHVLMCKLFKFEVTETNFINFDENSDSFGNVNFSYDVSFINSIGLFFTAIAPLFSSGTVVMILLSFIHTDFVLNFMEVFGGILHVDGLHSMEILKSILDDFIYNYFTINNITSIKFWFVIFIISAISVNVSLSKSDIKVMREGLPYFIPLIIIVKLLNSIVFKVEVLNLIFINFNFITLSVVIILLFFSLQALLMSYLMLILVNWLIKIL